MGRRLDGGVRAGGAPGGPGSARQARSLLGTIVGLVLKFQRGRIHFLD